MPSGDMDKMSRLIVAALLGTWLVFIGMTYHAEYPRTMIELSGQPWWRAILIAAVLASAYWCPRISVLAALALVLYLADVRALTQL
jgi:hypothetical protein